MARTSSSRAAYSRAWAKAPTTSRLRDTKMEQKRELRSREGLKIGGFENGKRTYGGARCYRSVVNDKYPAAILVIDRTHYDDSVMEIISPVNFRKELGLKNGDEVTVAVFA
jgi:riboflavin kinase